MADKPAHDCADRNAGRESQHRPALGQVIVDLIHLSRAEPAFKIEPERPAEYAAINEVKDQVADHRQRTRVEIAAENPGVHDRKETRIERSHGRSEKSIPFRHPGPSMRRSTPKP